MHDKQIPKERYISPEERQERMKNQKIIHLIDNVIADTVAKLYDDRITKVSKNSKQNNSETVTNEHDKEIP